MEEFIKYFYNIDISKLDNKKDRYIFEYDFRKFQLIDYKKNPNILYQNYLLFKNSNMCCHDILLNKDGEILSEYDGKKYLLLKENINSNKKVSLDDILDSTIINDKNIFSMKEKWKLKNDYYEEIFSKISSENDLIEKSFDYYIGLSELAINLLNYVDFNNVNNYIQHYRLSFNESLDEFYNPINMVIDSRIRDLALYLKSNFFNNYKLKNEKIFNSIDLNINEILLFLSRMLYPDYYFDVLDEIINDNVNNDKLKELIKKSSSYEDFIREIYNYLYNHYNIPKIEFLINQY